MSISIVLLTLNEEANLPRCLESLCWCDDIVVVDSYSSDRTVEIAKDMGARCLKRHFDNFAGQRNWALDKVDFRHEWVLHLDADEVCTDALQVEMCARIANSKYDAYRIPSKMMFMGRWLRFAGLYPSYQVRLGRQPVFRFRQVGHGQRERIDPARVGTLRQPYLHYSFSKGLADWFEKHNRYSTQEAQEFLDDGRVGRWDWLGAFALSDPVRRRRALKALSFRVPFRSTVRFLYMYLLRLGLLDGIAGFRYCSLLAMYESMIDVKIRELRRRRVGLNT